MCLKKRNEKSCVYMIDWCASDTVSLCNIEVSDTRI